MNQDDLESYVVKESNYIKPVTGPIKRDGLGNINRSLDDIVGTTLDVEKLFGADVAMASLDHNDQVNYMKLYDFLSEQSKLRPNDKRLMKLERVLDLFNRYRQYNIETESSKTAREELLLKAQNVKIVGETFTRSKGKSDPKMSNIMWEWQISLESGLNGVFEEIETIEVHRRKTGKLSTKMKASMAGGLLQYSEILFKLGTQSLGMILALEMAMFSLKESRRGATGSGKLSGSSHFTASLVQSLGKCVEEAYTVAVSKELQLKMNERTVRDTSHGAFDSAEETEIAHRLSNLSKSSLTSQTTRKYWATGKQSKLTTHDRVDLGTRLLTVILDNCMVPSTKVRTGDPVPAFWHTYEFHKSKYVGVIKLNESLVTQIARADIDLSAIILARTPPMLVKPRPWTSSTDGGYWYTKQSLLTTKPDNAPEQHAYLKAATEGHYMDNFLMCVDDLSHCAWSVNQPVLDTILAIWQSGDQYLAIPPLVRGKDPHELFGSIAREKLTSTEFNHMTERISLGYILRTAEMFAQHGERFYFPYKIDFRGRVYPLTNSGFWHLGADHVRSLFQFWYARPLGPRGLWWLKVHLANMYGVDKVPNEERAQFVEDNWNEVLESADEPLNGKRWWAKGDKPFQTLAACLEVVAAVRSGNPASFMSRLPVSQDGSCNGLQHYAALGRDVAGALQVNLVKSLDPSVHDGPQDVYSSVQKLVEDSIRKDASMEPDMPGYNEGTVRIAQQLLGKITRKVVKQPVMTSVYGVTQFGIVEQVIDKLKGDPDLEKAQLIYYGLYVARHIKTAIRTLFSNAHGIQDWLGECAERICESVRWDVYGDERLIGNRDFLKKFVSVVKWTTPLGLPVVQPYRKSPLMLIRTPLQTIALQNPFELSHSNKQKQKNGIAPNYIHGLDSTHLLMSAHESVERGLTFAAVHDSFWTHACDVDEMNRVLRAQFVKLHEGNLIASLAEEFEVRYAGHLQCVYVAQDSLAGQEICRLRASYFYGTGSSSSPSGSNSSNSPNNSTKAVHDAPEKALEQQRHQQQQQRYIQESLESGHLIDFKVHARDAVMVLRHELGEEFNRWKLMASSNEEEQQQGNRIVTPASIIEKYNEPVAWKISGRGSIFKTYDERFGSETSSKVDGGDQNKGEVGMIGRLHEEREQEEEQEQEEDEADDGSRAVSVNSKKWIRVLVPLRIPKIPQRGKLDIKQVHKSEYFFS